MLIGYLPALACQHAQRCRTRLAPHASRPAKPRRSQAGLGTRGGVHCSNSRRLTSSMCSANSKPILVAHRQHAPVVVSLMRKEGTIPGHAERQTPGQRHVGLHRPKDNTIRQTGALAIAFSHCLGPTRQAPQLFVCSSTPLAATPRDPEHPDMSSPQLLPRSPTSWPVPPCASSSPPSRRLSLALQLTVPLPELQAVRPRETLCLHTLSTRRGGCGRLRGLPWSRTRHTHRTHWHV